VRPVPIWWLKRITHTGTEAKDTARWGRYCYQLACHSI
jgi:hypothetical protein